jgi:hypothetical protein
MIDGTEAKSRNTRRWKAKRMPRKEYYTYSKTYAYEEEVPYEGAISDMVEGATTLVGDVTWGADIIWSEALGQYEIIMTWTDHGNHFSDIGEGPKDDDFLNDVFSYLDSQGIDLQEITY